MVFSSTTVYVTIGELYHRMLRQDVSNPTWRMLEEEWAAY
jgi:hypothetical protein